MIFSVQTGLTSLYMISSVQTENTILRQYNMKLNIGFDVTWVCDHKQHALDEHDRDTRHIKRVTTLLEDQHNLILCHWLKSN